MLQHLHIVCFDVPFPADYGGVFDLFYKLPALQKLGVQIHLHCFVYGRSKQPELEKYCVSVQYYNRVKKISFTLPYIVASRINERLFTDLLKDDYPILMEGVHCSYPLLDKRFSHRRLFVRLHNTEFIYYRYLYKSSSHLLKKIYYGIESILLKKYERRIADKATHFWAVSQTDVLMYRHFFSIKNMSYLPLFLPSSWRFASKEGSGAYCLYHGKLEVAENEKAAFWLLENVFAQLAVPFVIAGKNPSSALIKKIKLYPHVTLVANTSEQEMQRLISDAHIHILPSFNATGIKIKLLNALYNGRHCLVNTAAVAGTNLATLCHVADEAADMQKLIEQLLTVPFLPADIAQRNFFLQNEFDNNKSAATIVKAL